MSSPIRGLWVKERTEMGMLVGCDAFISVYAD